MCVADFSKQSHLFLAFFTAVIITPANLTARIGSPARFDCLLNGNDGYTRWFKGTNLQMITTTNCIGCNASLPNGSLVINSIDQSHAGMYACFIVGDPTTATIAYLTVAG